MAEFLFKFFCYLLIIYPYISICMDVSEIKGLIKEDQNRKQRREK